MFDFKSSRLKSCKLPNKSKLDLVSIEYPWSIKDSKVVVCVQVQTILPLEFDKREHLYCDHLNEVVSMYRHKGSDSIFRSGWIGF